MKTLRPIPTSTSSQSLVWSAQTRPNDLTTLPQKAPNFGFSPLSPLRHWLNHLTITEGRMAHRICRLIPAHCPFERTLSLFGHTLVRIPPLCKLNPLYEELIGLRFRALCYLADECHEDISQYC
jgi:hypothetical protein